MSELKCPFCQQELKEIYCNGIWVGLACKNVGCLETKSTLGNEGLWQELIRTRKALETLQEFVTKLYLNGNITDEQLERYKKMLITALEQKVTQ